AVGGGTAPQATTKKGKPIKVEVRKFNLTNGRVTLAMAGQSMTLPMPPVNLENLGTGQGGITPAELSFAVMRSVTANVVAATANGALKLGGTSGAAAAQGLRQAGDAIKSLIGGGKKQ